MFREISLARRGPLIDPISIRYLRLKPITVGSPQIHSEGLQLIKQVYIRFVPLADREQQSVDMIVVPKHLFFLFSIL